MIGFAICGLYEHFQLNKILLQLMNEHKECFYDNIQIEAFFGIFQFCIWDGGRVFGSYTHATIEQVYEIRDFFNNQNIPIRLIYTNNQLEEKHLSDRFCNLVTEICENDLNEIVVSSPLLEDYLRTNYPKYKYISSTTKCLNHPEEAIDELNKTYSEVCLDYNLNHNLTFLNNLPDELKEKVELLINPICGANCPNRKKHYKLNSLSTLNCGKQFKLDSCKIPGQSLYPFDKKERNEILPNDIYTTYSNMGFKHFKLEGRTFATMTHLCNCVKYLVKPEYQLFIIELANYLLQGEKINDQSY